MNKKAKKRLCKITLERNQKLSKRANRMQSDFNRNNKYKDLRDFSYLRREE